MSSVAAVDVEEFVARPETSVMFLSRRRDLRLVKTPIYPIMGPDGRKLGEQTGEVIPFHDGVLRLPAEGPLILADGRSADPAEVLPWLESHRLNGDQSEGFWRLDPVAPPPSEHEMQSIADAAITLDVGKLEAILEQETAGYGREALLNTARTSLERIRLAREQLDADQAAAVAAAEARGREGALKEARLAKKTKGASAPAEPTAPTADAPAE